MAPFIIVDLLLIFAIFFDKYEKAKYYVLISSSIFLTFFVGFRHNVGTDFMQYKFAYNSIKAGLDVDFEPAYIFIQKLSYDSIQAFFIVGLISIIFLVSYIKTFKHPNFALFVYYTLYLLQWQTGTIRQGVAICIFLFASTKYFSKKRSYFFLVILASLFHKSILLALLFPLFIKSSKKVQNIFVFFSFISMFLFIINKDIIINFISQFEWLPYITYFKIVLYLASSLFNVQFLIRLLFLSALLFIKKLNKHNNSKLDYLISISKFVICLNAIFMPYGVALRLIKPFEILLVLELTFLVISIFKNYQKVFIKYTVIFFLFAFNIFSIYKAPLYYPYEIAPIAYGQEHITLSRFKADKLIAAYKNVNMSDERINHWFKALNIKIVE